jgi:hypothetical protein
MKEPITQDRMENALAYLSDTDEQCADLRTEMLRSELKAKRVRSAVLKLSEGTSVQREAMADTAAETEAAWEEHFKAYRNYHAVNNKRGTAAIVVETWRSLNANRRQAQ